MKSKLLCVAGLVVGCLVGFWAGSYFEYTRTTAKTQREILKEYRDVKAAWPFDDLKRQNEMAAVIALSAFRNLAKGNVESAKAVLLQPIDSYYSLYHDKGGDNGLIDAIETAGKDFPEIAAVLAKKE